MALRVFITVAEVSGDQHGAQLVRAIKELAPDAIIEGHGGPLMQAAGAMIYSETTGRAAMGIGRHALGRVAEVWSMLKWTGRYFDKTPPDVLVCIDSPAMNFHFAKLAHERHIPVLYYIAPQLWAWREGRMKKLRRWVDRVACILPFEEPYFRGHGVDATFVGHPLFDELTVRTTAPDLAGRFPNRPAVIGLLAGSRKGEAEGNFVHQLNAASRIREAFPDVSFLSPTTAATDPVVRRLSHGFKGLEIARDCFDAMVERCDLCITVSGTAALHLAAHDVPTIVVYRVNPVAWALLGTWLIKTSTFSLVNLLAENRQHIIPEFVPWYGSDAPVADYAIDMLRHPEKLEAQRAGLLKLMNGLARSGASVNAAKMALEMARARSGAAGR